MREEVQTVTLGPELNVGDFELEKLTTGFVLRARSPMVHDLMASWKDPKDPIADVQRWGIRIYRINTLPVIQGVSFTNLGEPLLLDNFIVNLSFLRAVELGKGIEIKQDGVVPVSYVENVEKAVTRGLQEIYNEYLRPFKKRISLSTRVIDFVGE